LIPKQWETKFNEHGSEKKWKTKNTTPSEQFQNLIQGQKNSKSTKLLAIKIISKDCLDKNSTCAVIQTTTLSGIQHNIIMHDKMAHTLSQNKTYKKVDYKPI